MTEFLADGPDWHLWSWTGVWFSLFPVCDEWICSDIWELHAFNSCGYGAEEDASGFAKNVSLYTMCVPNAWRPIFAARHSYRTAQHSTRNWMKWEWHRLTGNVGMSTAYWCSILKISRIVHTINFILQFLYLASEFKDSISIFDQPSPRNCAEYWALKSLQFFHFTEAFLMSFTKIPVLLQ